MHAAHGLPEGGFDSDVAVGLVVEPVVVCVVVACAVVVASCCAGGGVFSDGGASAVAVTVCDVVSAG